VVPLLVRGAGAEAMMARTASDEWSPHETWLIWHAIFLAWLRRIIAENAPELARYRAEEDSCWSEWSFLTTGEVLHRMNSLRAETLVELSIAKSNVAGG
jgi:hypothetical protein